MVDWCENKLTVTGDWDSLMGFLTKCINPEGRFSFDELVPTPVGSGQQWRLDNWGTCADAEPDEECPGDVSYYIQRILRGYEFSTSFETQWSPPREWIKKASSQFPNLLFTLSYFEREQFFCGELVVSAGSEIRNDYEDSDCDYFWDILARTQDYAKPDIFV
ncbi:hypothetical protein [Bacteroides sp.]|uniref:DUF1281 family ferredoxin-like fold protein n=1 Tax=Bacteroides sp. TaxID=29523 RepID=UPI00262FA3CA|nr:hypothetical protein [Bacteroides sp.]MDD3040431.1 hypothetical protein [Bacteroides sp.]